MVADYLNTMKLTLIISTCLPSRFNSVFSPVCCVPVTNRKYLRLGDIYQHLHSKCTRGQYVTTKSKDVPVGWIGSSKAGVWLHYPMTVMET